MDKNLGKTDKIIRLGVGGTLLIAGFAGDVSSVIKWVLIVVGAILFITGVIGWCPIYKMLGVNTNKTSDDEMNQI